MCISKRIYRLPVCGTYASNSPAYPHACCSGYNADLTRAETDNQTERERGREGAQLLSTVRILLSSFFHFLEPHPPPFSIPHHQHAYAGWQSVGLHCPDDCANNFPGAILAVRALREGSAACTAQCWRRWISKRTRFKISAWVAKYFRFSSTAPQHRPDQTRDYHQSHLHPQSSSPSSASKSVPQLSPSYAVNFSILQTLSFNSKISHRAQQI